MAGSPGTPSQDHSPSGRLGALVDALSDRSISHDQAAELNRLLENDPASRRRYMELMRIEAELGAMHLPSTDRRVDDAAPSPVLAHRAGVASGGRQRAWFSRFAWAIAASVLISAACSSWLTLEGTRGNGPLASLLGPAGDGAAEQVAAPVALVAATRNCRWRGERQDLGFGAEVAGGQLLNLETGLAELTFADGARLVLEGPAAFRVAEEGAVELYSGRASAAVPEGVSSFSLRTPRLVVNESGVQYGVVADGGASEVHVFEGGVKAKAVDRLGNVRRVVELAPQQAARLADLGDRFSRFAADEERFVRSLDTRSGPGEGLLAFDNFAYQPGPVAGQNGGFGWAGAWVQLESEDDAVGGSSTNVVARGSLTTPEVVALGNRCLLDGQFNRIRRTLSTNLGGVFHAAGCMEVIDGFPMVRRTGGSIYLSFMQRISKTDDGFYGLELHRGDGNYNRVLCIGNDVDYKGYGVAVNFNERPGDAKFVSLGEEDDRINFIVVRIDYGEHERDAARVYRNPESLTDESLCTPTAEIEGIFGFDRVSIGNYNGSKQHEIDELRIGTTFKAVTGGSATWEQRGAAADDLARLYCAPGFSPLLGACVY
ncbi:FecR domain-containing protein [Botrimarina sp.]|uniref:FecR domain-containing protein n=1 Tax=Botrimarina sp. TaxID=2795802 RepID=UPI0032EBB422